ncbi:MAG: HAMP domain-containing protein [Desulfobacteraceae bacterium]|nr:MAG: HAMP domain-containing protein [Desulfobacteraceae bacterium]
MIGIRQKLMLAFGGLLAVVAAIGMLTMAQIDDLGQAIDVILKENYRSVVACQEMKESLERIDSGILFTLAGNGVEGNRLIEEYTSKFRAALDVGLGNITLPGERERAEQIRTLFDNYTKAMPFVTQITRSSEARQADYFSRLQPLFREIKDVAQKILLMNQANMNEANNAARRLADAAHRRVLMAIMVSAFLALLFSYLAHRWILHPINRLIESTNEIRRGNLDLVLKAGSRDEIGRLSESFNEMTASLRRFRKEDRINLMRTRRATEEVFKALPAAVAVLDLDGKVEVSTETADRHFGLKPGVLVGDLGHEWLPPLIRKALDEDRIIERDPKSGYVQQFVDNREYFFQAMVVPIPVGPERRDPTGVALILKDVTQVHEQQELKRGVVSTVSHQLKTPLTSLRMSIHLLLEERVGTLNEKQTELLVAARDDSERLVGILDDLLDLNRIESGKSHVSPEPVSPQALVRDAVEPFLVEARDKGVTMANAVPDDLPEVMADAEKIRQVFANLISNALRFTSPGGSVTVRAFVEANKLAFLVEDTGKGIPSESIDHIFEQFYRVPGQDEKSGVGLGLAIVKEIVSAHGGNVGVESEIGRGSIFHFTLPLSEATNAQHTTRPMKGASS